MARDRIEVLVPFALSRAVVWVAGAIAIVVRGVHENAERFDPDGITRPFGEVGRALVGPGSYWDSQWYLDIADDGYEDGRDAAFFPLYPLLVRVAGLVVGSDVVGGILVSLGCLLGALWVLHRLVLLDYDERVASLTVLLVAVFPAAVFFSAVYSESLFLLVSVAAVYFAKTDRWALAGLAGVLATATRSAGVVLLVPLLVLWWQSGRRPRDLAWLAIVPLGLAAFCLFLEAELGDGWAVFRAQENWEREMTWPFGAIPRAAEGAWNAVGDIVEGRPRTWPVYDTAQFEIALFGSLVLTLVALVGALRRLPRAYSLYALAALALPLSFPVAGQPLMSLPRFVAVIWPLHLWLALVLVDRPRARAAVVAVSVVGLALVSIQVSTWGWIA